MKYITGIHALNLNCELETCGDWHQSALAWKDLSIRESEESIFKDWGIEFNRSIPNNTEKYAVANHIRACLDMLETNDFINPQGMRHDFICNESYNNLVFEKVYMLKDSDHWNKIDEFMGREYNMHWVRFRKDTENENK